MLDCQVQQHIVTNGLSQPRIGLLSCFGAIHG